MAIRDRAVPGAGHSGWTSTGHAAGLPGPMDGVTFTTIAGFLKIVSLVACYHPARLAATADPMTILRR